MTTRARPTHNWGVCPKSPNLQASWRPKTQKAEYIIGSRDVSWPRGDLNATAKAAMTFLNSPDDLRTNRRQTLRQTWGVGEAFPAEGPFPNLDQVSYRRCLPIFCQTCGRTPNRMSASVVDIMFKYIDRSQNQNLPRSPRPPHPHAAYRSQRKGHPQSCRSPPRFLRLR